MNTSDFIIQQPDWGGLYKAGDTLERRRLREEQQRERAEGRKQASATFLKNYLDPKDYMSGTAYDPLIVQGLDDAMQQGMELAAKGVDTPTMMMALGPLVKKISGYSSRAKTLNQQMDDQIKNMKATGLEGYDYMKLKDEAMRSALFDVDQKTGQATLNPDKADPSVNWIAKTIQDSPEKVTTSAGIDEFAKKSPMTKTLSDIQQYDAFGNLDRRKVHLVGQNWLVPEVDDKGATIGMVPEYETAVDDGQPIMHTFTGKDGKPTKAPVRVLDEKRFDALPKGVIDNLRGQAKLHLQEYETSTGQKISENDPRAKLVTRALAYDELNRRKASTIESAEIIDRPSGAQATLATQQTAAYINNEFKKAQARAAGRESVETTSEREKAEKGNAIQSTAKIFRNDPDYMTAGASPFTGTVKEYGSDKTTQFSGNVIDVTTAFPGGGLKSGRGEDHKFSKIMYDPANRSLIIEKVEGTGSKKKTTNEQIPESKVGQFMYEVAEANGIPRSTVKKKLEEMGYSGQKFTGAGEAPKMPEKPAVPPQSMEKLESFKKDGGGVSKLSGFKGTKIGELTVVDIEGIYNPFNSNEYRVNLKHSNGSKSKKEFKTSEELYNYLKSAGGAAKPAAAPGKPASKGILD